MANDDIRIEQSFTGDDHWCLYRRMPVVDGKHPVHNTDTTETEVWVKLGEGTEEGIRAQAEALNSRRKR